MKLVDKELKNFLKKIYDLNQIMKNIYKDEPNFSPSYILTNKKAIYADIDCIPEIIKYDFNEPIETEFRVIVHASDFFSVFKDSKFKEDIKSIVINKDSIEFCNDNSVIYKLSDDESIITKIDTLCNNYAENCSDNLLWDFNLKEEIIKEVVNKNKELIQLVCDVDNVEAYNIKEIDIDELEDIAYFEMFLNKKFINGISYKEKKLKSGNKIEYTPIHIRVYETPKNDIYYAVNLIVFLKNKDAIEHHFIICDF
jgi:hypothetical protein